MSSLPHVGAPPADQPAGIPSGPSWTAVLLQASRRAAALAWRLRRRRSRQARSADALQLFETAELRLLPKFVLLQQELRGLYPELAPPGREEQAKLWALTSALPREGKSTVAGILAYTLSEDLGQPVLLIEGELRRPVLAETFRVPSTPGLSDVLAGDCGVFEALHETSKTGLWLLPAGTPIDSPAGALRAGPIDEFLSAARKEFGAVVLDVPAVLSRSEGPVLLDWADRSLLVVAGGQTTFAQARKALALLGPRAAGIVLNAVEPALPDWVEGLLGTDGE